MNSSSRPRSRTGDSGYLAHACIEVRCGLYGSRAETSNSHRGGHDCLTGMGDGIAEGFYLFARLVDLGKGHTGGGSFLLQTAEFLPWLIAASCA